MFLYRKPGPSAQVLPMRSAGWILILHLAAMAAGIVGAAMITAHWFPRGNEPGGFVVMGGLLIAITYALYRSLRHWLPTRERTAADERPAARPAIPATAPPQPPPAGAAGCFAFLGFVLLIIGGGIGAALITYSALDAALTAVMPGSRAIYHIALGGCLIACLSTMFLLDRWCEKKTGGSVLQLLSQLTW